MDNIIDVAVDEDIIASKGVKTILECQKKNQELRAQIAADERLISALMERLKSDNAECEICFGGLYINGRYVGRRI
ncbi:MAG: hypothetical protein HFE63_01440 [Clostridiales bacterium]|nr:hypothetical protein [Clostridiales bacterium]